MTSYEIREDYVNRDDNVRFGDSGGWIPACASTRGGVFRDAQAEYGRCISRMYRDRRIDPPLPVAFGVRLPVRWVVDDVGWVFAKRMRYEDARRDPYTGRYRDSDYYLREVWVEVREACP